MVSVQFSTLAGDQLPCRSSTSASEVSKWISQEEMLIIWMGLGVKNAICSIKRISKCLLFWRWKTFCSSPPPLPKILDVWRRSHRGIKYAHTSKRLTYKQSQTITQTWLLHQWGMVTSFCKTWQVSCLIHEEKLHLKLHRLSLWPLEGRGPPKQAEQPCQD